MPIKRDLRNVVEDNTITLVCDQLTDLMKTLEAEGELSVEWFRENSDKFQAIILNRKEDPQATHKLIIDNKEIKTINSIKLPGINIDNQ